MRHHITPWFFEGFAPSTRALANGKSGNMTSQESLALSRPVLDLGVTTLIMLIFR